MEPRDRAPQELSRSASPEPEPGAAAGAAAARSRTRAIASCLLLVGLAFTQTPGFVVADTKFDLSADPQGFLARALHLWDPSGALGQLQNQAYGYLWPMGPFFVLGHLLAVPAWIVQRGWMALLLCVAFVGTVKVARALGVRSDVAVLAAGFSYALSPRILSTLGTISIESWPSALAPWVLLPLITGSRTGSPRRAALLAGLAVAMIGGVNAAATAAVLPIGVIWLLTRQAGPRRTRLLVWWPVFTVIGTLWWLLPLALLGAYSPPFLDFIESASITTFPTTVFDALRGTSDWVPYVDPSWRGGHTVLTQSYLALNSGLVLGGGLAGMLLRRNPHRAFLFTTLVVGLLLVGMGHLGSVQGWAAGPMQGVLDGALAPLRNVHKFDPVVRLPLVLGLGFVLDALLRPAGRDDPVLARAGGARQPLVAAMVLVGVVGSTTPALVGGLAPSDPVLATPTYWSQTVTWLDQRSDQGAALLAPGSGFGDYLWGSPRDEPAQYLGARRWAVRNAVPLTPAGGIRALDTLEDRFAQGRPSSGLATYLARLGVRFVVVRNDLTPGSDVPDPVLVHQTLAESPGLVLAQSFGPQVGGEPSLQRDRERLVVNGGWQATRRAVEVWEVVSPTPEAVVASVLSVVVGGPEDLLDLDDLGVLNGAPSELAVDLPTGKAPSGPVVLTDGLADRERFFGRVHDATSAVLTPGDVPRSGNPVKSYVLPDQSRWTSRALLVGARAISASSSASDATAPGGSRRGELAYAALDGDDTTSWISDVGQTGAPWWQVDLDQPVAASSVTLTLGPDAGSRAEVRVVTDVGVSDEVELREGEPVEVPLDGRPVSRLRVEATRPGARLSLTAVALPGLEVQRRIVVPSLPSAWGAPQTVVLRRLSDARTGCVDVEVSVPCVADRAVGAEEPTSVHRDVTLPQAQDYTSVLRASPRPGPALDRLLLQGRLLSVTGSSTGPADPRASALAAVDGDPGTSWTPALDDLAPQLALNWIGPRTVTGLRLRVADGAPVQRPTALTIAWPGGTREVTLDGRGRVSFDPITTTSLTVQLTADDGALSLNAEGVPEQLPPGISELRVRGMPFEPLVLSTDVVTRACGTGPSITVDGVSRPTRLVASEAQLYALQSVTVAPCGSDAVSLAAGENDIDLEASPVSVPDSLVLQAGSGADAGTTTSVGLDRSSPVSLTAGTSTGAGTLVVRQNQNPGWRGSQDGTTLDQVVVDGWQQGWTLARSGPVTGTFAPDRVYRVSLLVGGVIALLLPTLLLVGRRRRWPGRDLAPVDGAWFRTLPLGVLAALAGGLLGGWPGLGLAAGGCVAGVLLRRRHPASGPPLVGAALFVAASAYAIRPWGSSDGWAGSWPTPHYLVLAALGIAVAWVGSSGPNESIEPSRSRTLNRIAGRSTTR